jgi:hypothetical protein
MELWQSRFGSNVGLQMVRFRASFQVGNRMGDQTEGDQHA